MAAHLRASRFLLFWQVVAVFAFYNVSVTELRLVETTLPRLGRRNGGMAHEQLGVRAVTTEMSTCGYVDGDPSKIRTANSGYDCRIDITKGLWGFCPTTVISASDCGLAGVCVDNGACSSGCGLTGTEGVTTFTCTKSGEMFCSTALMDRGVDQTFSYIACGASEEVVTLLAEPTDESSPTTTSGTSTSVTDMSSSSTPAPASVASTTAMSGSLPTGGSEPTSQAQQQQTGGSTTNTGGIIGGVLGGLALVCGTILAAVYLLRRGRQKQRESQEAASAINAMAQSSPSKDYATYSIVPPSEADSLPVAQPQTHLAEVYGSPAWRQQHPGNAQELP